MGTDFDENILYSDESAMMFYKGDYFPERELPELLTELQKKYNSLKIGALSKTGSLILTVENGGNANKVDINEIKRVRKDFEEKLGRDNLYLKYKDGEKIENIVKEFKEDGKVVKFGIIEGKPCRILSAKEVKNGYPNVKIEAIGILDNKKRSILKPEYAEIDVPILEDGEPIEIKIPNWFSREQMSTWVDYLKKHGWAPHNENLTKEGGIREYLVNEVYDGHITPKSFDKLVEFPGSTIVGRANRNVSFYTLGTFTGWHRQVARRYSCVKPKET